jgi:hypothetical protein
MAKRAAAREKLDSIIQVRALSAATGEARDLYNQILTMHKTSDTLTPFIAAISLAKCLLASEKIPVLRLFLNAVSATTFSLSFRHVTDSRGGEMSHGALHAIALTSSLSGFDGVEIGRFWLQAVHAHAKNHIGVVPVHVVGRFRCLAKFLGIRTIMHDTVMLVRAPGVVGCPPDDGRIVVSVSQFELWPVRDPDVCGCLSRRRNLRRSVRCFLSGH